MERQRASMERAGFNKRLTMLQVLARGVFHQDFLHDEETVDEALQGFVERVRDNGDLKLLGASIWPGQSDIVESFSRALLLIERRIVSTKAASEKS